MEQQVQFEQALRLALADKALRSMFGNDERVIEDYVRLKLKFPNLKFFNLALPPQAQMAYVAPPGQEYVDPYLFETGHFASREEYEELSRTAKIKPRAKP